MSGRMNWAASTALDRVRKHGAENLTADTLANSPRPGRKTTRRMPPRQCPISESEPIETHKMWKDRSGNALVFSLKSYQGRPFFDLRIFFTDSAGILRPTPKGITASPNKLPEIAKAIDKTLRKAIELGLLDEESEAGE